LKGSALTVKLWLAKRALERADKEMAA